MESINELFTDANEILKNSELKQITGGICDEEELSNDDCTGECNTTCKVCVNGGKCDKCQNGGKKK